MIGPALAGFLADRVGNAGTFSIMGLIGITTAIFLLAITPENINIEKSLEAQK